MNRFLPIALAALLGLGGYYSYKSMSGGMDHGAMNHGAASADTSPSTKEYEAAMSTMMQGMHVASTGKPDIDFMQGMIPHHQGAIDMAKIVLKHGKDAEVKTFADAVVKAQDGEIALMKDWLAKVNRDALVASPESVKANEASMATMMKAMMVPYSGDADIDFVKGMIPHHQGAVDASRVAQQYAKDPVVLKLAGEIIAAQEKEISFMQDWLKKKGM